MRTVLVALLLVAAACTVGDDVDSITIRTSPPSPVAPQAVSEPVAVATVHPTPIAAPDLERRLDWTVYAGTDATHSALGGITVGAERMQMTDVDRACPDGADEPAPVCAHVTPDTRTIVVADVVVINDTGLRLEVVPGDSAIALGDRDVPATLFAGSTDPVPVDDGGVRGDLQWVTDTSIDAIRDRGTVTLRLAVPVLPGMAADGSRLELDVDL